MPRGCLRALLELPLRRPGLVLVAVVLSLLPAAWCAGRLELRTSFSELLPESRPSVVELRRVGRRLAGTSTLIIAVEGRDADSLRRLVDGLAPKLHELGPRYVAGVDTGARPVREFVEQNKLLYAPLEELRALRDEIAEAYDRALGKRMGLDLGLLDDEEPATAPVSERVRARLEEQRQRLRAEIGEDYYLGEGGKLAAIVVTTPFEAGDPRTFELTGRIRELVRALDPAAWDPGLRVHFTGSLVTSAEEHRAIVRDLTEVGAIGLTMIIAAIWLFFGRLRALFALGATIAVGSAWTFAATYLWIGHLNSASGFLVSIVAGNGINFGIILTARYLEARLDQSLPAFEAVSHALRDTAVPTASVALTASVAYGSLAVTDFRGFRHFGMIAGAGMGLCWIASYSCLPALLLLCERFAPLAARPRASLVGRLRGVYGRPFAYLAGKRSRLVLGLAMATTVLSSVLAAAYVARDPLEYDMRQVRSDDRDPSSARQLARRVDDLVSRLRRDGHALLVDRLDQVEPLVHELERRKRAAPPGQQPFERVVSVFDLLPDDQEQKLELWSEIAGFLRRARAHGAISDQDWSAIAPELARAPRPLGIADLPANVVWPFRERDGRIGRIVYLVPTEGESLNDAHYLMRWADSFREVLLPNGEVIHGTGPPVIYSDVLESVRDDAPWAMFSAIAGTCLVILLTFRARWTGRLAVSCLLLGLVWLLAYLAVTGTRINFLNFVALPISVGVGADYAINVLKRHEHEREADPTRVLVNTGGAVVLCSLTTVLGYGALLFSINGAVRSFGATAVAGELTALLAAMLVLPSILFMRHARKRRARSELDPSYTGRRRSTFA